MTNLARRPRVLGANGLSLGPWPAHERGRLVAMAVENRVSFRRSPHMSFAAASDCRTNTIYEHTPGQRMSGDQFKSVRGVRQ